MEASQRVAEERLRLARDLHDIVAHRPSQDVDIAREDLIARGVDVSEIWGTVPGQPPATGVHRSAHSYSSWASFAGARTATGGSCRRSPRGYPGRV